VPIFQIIQLKFPLVRRGFYLTLGAAMATFGLKGFLIQKGLIDGGVTGISLLIAHESPIPLPILIIGLTLPFAVMASKLVNTLFAIRSIIAVCMLALGLTFFEFPLITTDMWLVSVFGGFFIGAGMGLVIRGGAIIDGTEILSIYLSRKISISSSDISLLLNILLFILAAYLLDIEAALYSVLTYFSTSKTADYIVSGIEEYIGVTIVTERSEEMREMIINKLGRGVTLYYGEMGYGKSGEFIHDTKIIYTIITRLELTKLQHEINLVDKQAFTIMNPVIETRGGMIKKRPIQKNKIL
jgi:uncharacterized membrane-anchored protein YitT (DUF2179 family)